jgi:choloylglycine hydrolase
MERNMCTNFLLQTADKQTHVVGRSMEFGQALHSKVLIRAAKHHLALGEQDEQEHALSVTPTYNYVGLTSLGLSLVSDGLNTAGLTIGTLWLPGSVYPSAKLGATNVPVFCFPDYVLGHFATVAEVREALASGKLQVFGGKLVEKYVPVHFPIIDATGASIVVEFEDGETKIRENPVGICTNRPFLPWHLTNLANFAGLSAWDPAIPTFNGFQPMMNGHGSGLRGMPGDYTPPSRFIRTAYLRQWADLPTDAETAMQQAFHLLNNVDIPKGAARAMGKDIIGKEHEEQDHTQWIVVKNLTTPEIRIRTYDNPLVYRLSLASLAFDTLNNKQFALPSGPTALDFPLSA